jgi:hypothetical protein
MTDKFEPVDIDLKISNLISNSQDRLFEYFDDLHKQGINDSDVIRSLRRTGERDLAEGYIEWTGALDPDVEDNNTTLDTAVPDPGDSPSYEALGKALNRNAINAYLRSEEIRRFGAQENTLQILRKHIPKGTRVAYWPDGDYRSAVWTEAVTLSEVFVHAGIPVVSLESGRQAVPLTHLQVIG